MHSEVFDRASLVQATNNHPAGAEAGHAFYPNISSGTTHESHHSEGPDAFGGSHHAPGAMAVMAGTDDSVLLRLQCRLHSLLSDTSTAAFRENRSVVVQVLSACKDLLEILQGILFARGHLPNSTMAVATPGQLHSQPTVDAGHAEQNPSSPTFIIVLQVITCYGYALQLLGPTVEALASPAGDMGSVSLGTFNLASQPAMSSYVAMHMVLRMIHQLRESIHLLVSGCDEFANARSRTSSSHSMVNESLDGAETPQSTEIADSIRFVAEMVIKKETALDERLSCFIKSQSPLSWGK